MVSIQPHPCKAYSMHSAPGQPAMRTSFGIASSAAFDNELNLDMMTQQQAPVAAQHMWQQQQQAQYSPGVCSPEPGWTAAGMDTCRGQYSQFSRSPIAPAARMGCSSGPAGFSNPAMPPMPGSPLQYTAQQQWRLPSASQRYMRQCWRQQQQPVGLQFNGSTAASTQPVAAPFRTVHAHSADVWQRSERGATAAEHALQASLTMSAGPQGQFVDRTSRQPPPLVLHQELQQLLVQQQQQRQCLRTAGMTPTGPLAGQRHFAAPHGMEPAPGRGMQVVRRPACKRKPAALLQGDKASRPVYKRLHEAGSLGDLKEETAAARDSKLSDSPPATPAEAAAPAGCCALSSHGDIAALLGACSSDQAAAQLHNMSRQQLFAFAAQVVAGSADLCSSDGEGSSGGAATSRVVPPRSALVPASLHTSAELCMPAERSNGCAAAAGAACAERSGSQSLDEVLLPAVQLEDFYSKPMSPAEAAAEAAAVAKAIVAAAKAAAAGRVHSSRSCSPASPETFELPQSSGGLGRQSSGGSGATASGGTPGADPVLGRDAPHSTLLVPCLPPQAVCPQGAGSVSLPLQLGSTAATSSRLARTAEQQQSALRGKARGMSGSCIDVRLRPVSAQDPSLSAAAEGSLELGCTPSSSQTGHGFESSLGLGLGMVQDESYVWQAESTAAWGLSDLSDLGFD